jgi:hypothetical protein
MKEKKSGDELAAMIDAGSVEASRLEPCSRCVGRPVLSTGPASQLGGELHRGWRTQHARRRYSIRARARREVRSGLAAF